MSGGSLLAAALLHAVTGCSSAPKEPSPSPVQRMPNIIVVLADDMGWGDPACFNPESRIATPHIDRLAAEGMRFTDAHAPGSWCVPSRYGLLTGRYPHRRGPLHPAREAVLEEDTLTLPELLAQRGYRTGMVGKWHLGFDAGGDPLAPGPMTGGPLDRGFHSYFGIPSSLDIPPYYFIRGRRPVAPPTERVAASGSEGWTRIQGAFWREGGIAPGFSHELVLPELELEAVRVVDEHAARDDGTPLFLYLALPSPHTPWLPRAAFAGTSAADMYGDFVSQTDAVLGSVLEALERGGMSDDTLVVFTSDNGPVWYPADEERLGHHSTGPWRGMKSDSWEGGHRMPFVVRWPGHIPAGASSQRLICFTDLMSTCADLTGGPAPPGAAPDSVSFRDVLLGREQAPRGLTVLGQDARVVREGSWKLIDHLGSGGFSHPRRVEAEPGGPLGQLYELERDPGETENLWTSHPEVVARLRSASLEVRRR